MSGLLALVDRLFDFLIGRAYTKFGPKRYELRSEIRRLLHTADGLIDKGGYPASIRAILKDLDKQLDLLPKRDLQAVRPARDALETLALQVRNKNIYTLQETNDKAEAEKAARKATRDVVREALAYLTTKLRV